jgi:acetolactate synthase I/II/III large subunit
MKASDWIAEFLDAVWSARNDPFLLRVAIDVAANACSKIAFGRPITEMEPFARPVAL